MDSHGGKHRGGRTAIRVGPICSIGLRPPSSIGDRRYSLRRSEIDATMRSGVDCRNPRREGLDELRSVFVLQHTPIETLGTIEDALRGHRIGAEYIETHAGKPVPGEMAGKAGVIVMGGPMGVYEQAKYPFLRDEMRLIESALTLGIPVLGVCLGSQLLAAVLGAEVKKGERKE